MIPPRTSRRLEEKRKKIADSSHLSNKEIDAKIKLLLKRAKELEKQNSELRKQINSESVKITKTTTKTTETTKKTIVVVPVDPKYFIHRKPFWEE